MTKPNSAIGVQQMNTNKSIAKKTEQEIAIDKLRFNFRAKRAVRANQNLIKAMSALS